MEIQHDVGLRHPDFKSPRYEFKKENGKYPTFLLRRRKPLSTFLQSGQTKWTCCVVLRCGAVWCGVLQCAALCCSTLWFVAVFCSVFKSIMPILLFRRLHDSVFCVTECVAACCSVLQCVAVKDTHSSFPSSPLSSPLCAAVCCSVLQCVAVCCSVLQCAAVCCSVLQSMIPFLLFRHLHLPLFCVL